MINIPVKKALLRIPTTAKQVANDLNMNYNIFRLTVGGFRNNAENIEKIARYLNIKPKFVNRNYKGNGK